MIPACRRGPSVDALRPPPGRSAPVSTTVLSTPLTSTFRPWAVERGRCGRSRRCRARPLPRLGAGGVGMVGIGAAQSGPVRMVGNTGLLCAVVMSGCSGGRGCDRVAGNSPLRLPGQDDAAPDDESGDGEGPARPSRPSYRPHAVARRGAAPSGMLRPCSRSAIRLFGILGHTMTMPGIGRLRGRFRRWNGARPVLFW